VISIFDDDHVRQAITWNGTNMNDPEAEAKEGFIVDTVAFSTPTNFNSEPIDDVVKNGGGIEFYNPRVGTRVLNIRGRVHAQSESRLNSLIRPFQESFHPLYLQVEHNTGWPPPNGAPDWIAGLPLTFTRVMPRTYAPSAFADGKVLLQYYVVPLQLPDPIRSTTQTGLGAVFDASWIVMEGGRAYARSESNITASGAVAPAWGEAPMWPRFHFTFSGAGASNLTMAVDGDLGATLVVNASGMLAGETLEVRTATRAILDNGADGTGLYVSGDFPSIDAGGANVTFSNTTGVSANVCYYRESDYF
jgi:hypothetical protein